MLGSMANPAPASDRQPIWQGCGYSTISYRAEHLPGLSIFVLRLPVGSSHAIGDSQARIPII